MSRTAAAPPERILLVRLSHLGDVVHALPVFHALRERAPRARLAWAVQPEFAPLVESLPGLERVVPFARREGLTAWWRLRRALRDFGAQWAVDAQGNAKSAAVTWLSGAPRRTGLHPADWREPAAARVLNDPAPRLAGSRALHAVERSLHLADHLRGGARPPDGGDWLRLGDEELAAGRARYAELLGDARGAVVLQLADPADVRAWPLAHQLELLRRLALDGRPALALSGPGEADLGRRVADELRGQAGVAHWVDQRGLRELAAFLRAAAERAARFVGGDSGPLHLACAAGLPVLCLSGPQDPRRTGPWPLPGDASPHRVLRAPAPLYCAPCLARRCGRDEGVLCMQGIRPEQVLRALVSSRASGSRARPPTRAGR